MQNVQTSGQRWRAFALLVVAYFITIVDFTIMPGGRTSSSSTSPSAQPR